MPSTLKLQPYKSIAEHLYEALRDEIVRGKLLPGEKLVPREIAARLGCSPMPVRDAIMRLATEGFVTVSPRKVTQVATLSRQEMDELFAVRAVLEAYAARLGCSALTESELHQLAGMVDSMAARLRANDLRGWFRLNQQFHFLVFDRANNSTLRGILVDLWDKTLRSRAMVVLDRPEFVAQRMDEHRAILQAFHTRDTEAAERLWREHIARSGEETRVFFATAQGADSGPSREGPLRSLMRGRSREKRKSTPD
jgi:DNA-binding GntR family transcriptional regulator